MQNNKKTIFVVERNIADIPTFSTALLKFVLSLPSEEIREKVHTVSVMQSKSLEETQSMILDYVTSKSGGIFLAPLEPGNAYNVYLGIRKEIKDDPSITVEKIKGKDIEQLIKSLNEAIQDHISTQEQGSWVKYTGQGNEQDQCRMF